MTHHTHPLNVQKTKKQKRYERLNVNGVYVSVTNSVPTRMLVLAQESPWCMTVDDYIQILDNEAKTTVHAHDNLTFF